LKSDASSCIINGLDGVFNLMKTTCREIKNKTTVTIQNIARMELTRLGPSGEKVVVD
jgi:hypothetical protein